MATEQKGNSGRIYQSKPAEVTYQGAAQSIGFNPVRAVDSSKALQQYAAQIEQDGNTKRRELQRDQQLYNTSLQAQQRAEAGKQKLEQQIGSFGLQREQQAAQAQLKINQLYDQQTLKQKHTYEQGLMSLEASQQSLSNQVSNAKFSAIESGINSLLSFGGDLVDYAAERAELKEEEEKQTSIVNAAFNIGEPTAAPVNQQARAADSQIANNTVVAEDAIQAATPSANTQNSLREDGVSQQTLSNQVRRSNAYNAANDFGAFYSNWVNDVAVEYTRADGSTFTVGTMRDASDVAQVDAAARRAFYGAAGLENLATRQLPELERVSCGRIFPSEFALDVGTAQLREARSRVPQNSM